MISNRSRPWFSPVFNIQVALEAMKGERTFCNHRDHVDRQFELSFYNPWIESRRT